MASKLGRLVNRGAGIASRLYRAITGRAIPSEVKQTDAQRIAELEKSAGSGRKAAAALGVPESTWRGWRKRGIVPEARMPAVEQAQRRARLTPGREANLRKQLGAGLKIKGWVSVSDERATERNFLAREWFTEQDNQNIINAYLSGNDERLEAALEAAIDDSYLTGDWSDISVSWT